MSAVGDDTTAKLEWSSLAELLDVSPNKIVSRSPQLAKDIPYAKAVQDAWKEEIAQRTAAITPSTDAVDVEWTKVSYATADTGNGVVPLFGYCLRRRHHLNAEHDEQSTLPAVAGIVMFHTGAGPHDIFLLWKAESILHELHDSVGYVLIADILSDETGWAWSPDRTCYDQARAEIFQRNANDGRRAALQERVTAALTTLSNFPRVDLARIGALGWCLGGQPIWELALTTTTTASKMSENENAVKIRCMATFHGVCDGVCDDSSGASTIATSATILICSGVQDPFVPQSDLTRCIDKLRQHGHNVRLLEFPNAKHGFTNPAQAFNPHPAFDFDRESAREAWQHATSLFRELLSAA